MASEMISLRIDEETKDRLEKAAEAEGTTRSALVTRYVEEGLLMDAHPGIVFRPGPAGRRPALPAGPDVWEVVRVIRNGEETGEAAIETAAEWLDLSPDRVRVAVDFYAAHPEGIDARIERMDEQAREAEEAWRTRQDLLR